MSTEIKSIKGSCHYDSRRGGFDVQHGDADVSLTRFYNGKERGRNIQLTVCQDVEHGESYIHLNKEKCEELAKALLECFDESIYPSE